MTLLAPRAGNDDSYVMLYFVVLKNVSLFHLVSWIPLRGCVCCDLNNHSMSSSHTRELLCRTG